VAHIRNIYDSIVSWEYLYRITVPVTRFMFKTLQFIPGNSIAPRFAIMRRSAKRKAYNIRVGRDVMLTQESLASHHFH
jgi:hypothetical protein